MRIIIVLGLAALLQTTGVQAADDPNIPKERKAVVQQAMTAFIDANQVDDHFVIYDAVEGKLLRLRLAELHAGVVKKGEFYVSCADFTDGADNPVDVDFLVGGKGENLKVLEGVVHEVAGKKRPYHVEEMPTGSDD
jgi:hypothetical protein